MRRSITRIAHGLAATLLLLVAACGDPPPAPEQAVREWVERGEALAEDKDRRALVDMIAEAYTDGRGNTRDDISDMFRAVFIGQKTVSLIVSIDDIEVYGDSAAQLSLTVGMAGLSNTRFGMNADAYKFEMELEQRDDEWLLYSARWAPVGGDLR
ncbi:MAG: hypothetical protein AAF351_01545 [Pseudomonadota bacterium]